MKNSIVQRTKCICLIFPYNEIFAAGMDMKLIGLERVQSTRTKIICM